MRIPKDLWRGPRGEGGTEVGCQQPCEKTILEGDSPVLGKPLNDCNFWRDPEPKPHSEAAPEFLTLRNYEMLSACCFK